MRAKRDCVVVNVITSVAEQINLLALNAIIEAVRAGSGMSAAVVASGSEEPARKTAKSSEEIRAKIEEM